MSLCQCKMTFFCEFRNAESAIISAKVAIGSGKCRWIISYCAMIWRSLKIICGAIAVEATLPNDAQRIIFAPQGRISSLYANLELLHSTSHLIPRLFSEIVISLIIVSIPPISGGKNFPNCKIFKIFLLPSL